MRSIDELFPQSENDTSEKVTLADVATVGKQIADAIKARLSETETETETETVMETETDTETEPDQTSIADTTDPSSETEAAPATGCSSAVGVAGLAVLSAGAAAVLIRKKKDGEQA